MNPTRDFTTDHRQRPVDYASAEPITSTITVTVRFFAAAKARRGSAQETWTQPVGSTIADGLSAVGLADDPVFARSSFLVDGRAVTASHALSDAERVDVLPPFAGG